MREPRRAVLAASLLSVSLASCPAPATEDEPGEDCFMHQPPTDTSGWPTRELVIGSVDGSGELQPWVEGQTLALELGFQGAYMLTPSFEVEAHDGDDDEACWFVRVTVGAPDRPIETDSGVYPGGLVFERGGERMRAGPLFHVVDGSLAGTEQRIDVAVFGPDFEATRSLSFTVASLD